MPHNTPQIEKNLRKQKRNGVRLPVRVEDLKGGALTLQLLRIRVTLVEDKGPQPPPLAEGEPPTPHLRVSRWVKKRQAPSSPSAGGTDKSSENAKKRRLNWHSTCLQAAGVEVNFAEEG